MPKILGINKSHNHNQNHKESQQDTLNENQSSSSEGIHVGVIVLGDTGRSPRMQYHTISLINMINPSIQRVSLIGYHGEKCNNIIQNNSNIYDIRISTTNYFLDWLRIIPLFHAILKGFYLLFTLLYTLFTLPHLHIILIQNPPSIPAAIASLILSYFTGTIIIIDWHNLGFSLYFDHYQPTHILIQLTKYLEGYICSQCHYHISVSKAMSDWLMKSFHLNNVIVLYDRPPSSVFIKYQNNSIPSSSSSSSTSPPLLSLSTPSPSSSSSSSSSPVPEVPINIRHELLMKLQLNDEILFPYNNLLGQQQQLSSTGSLNENISPAPTPSSISSLSPVVIDPTWVIEKTIQTIKYKIPSNHELNDESSEIVTTLRPDRAVLLISSTSWSPDEDFTILLKSLQNLDRSLIKRRSEGRSKDRTRIVVVITGKGPLKDLFMNEWFLIQQNHQTRLQYISLTSLWLESLDYPKLLSCADLGICLHTSSSGLDLPMKILDMFGSGIPVCAFYYPTLPELVKNGENGIVFRSHSELAAHLYRLYCESPYDSRTTDEITKMKRNAYNIGDWETNWNKVMIPIIHNCLTLHKSTSILSKSHVQSLFILLSMSLICILGIILYYLNIRP